MLVMESHGRVSGGERYTLSLWLQRGARNGELRVEWEDRLCGGGAILVRGAGSCGPREVQASRREVSGSLLGLKSSPPHPHAHLLLPSGLGSRGRV